MTQPARQPTVEPVARRTRSATTHSALCVTGVNAAQRKYLRKLLDLWCTPAPPELAAMPVLDELTGETLEFRQLRHHPRYKDTWAVSYANELGRLCQGIGKGDKGTKKQRVKGTNTFNVIKYEDIPLHKRGDICHSCVVCKV